MPIYEYQCQECGRVSEELQRFDDPPMEECRECGGPVRKLISAPAFQFKGSGWYVTDYAGKGKDRSDGGGDKPSGDGAKSDGSSGDGKSGAKGSAKSAEPAAAKAAKGAAE